MDASPHKIRLSLALWQEDAVWFVHCLEFGVGGSGASPDDAVEDAMGAVESYVQTLAELGEREQVFAQKTIVPYVIAPVEWRFPRLLTTVTRRRGFQMRTRELTLDA